MYGSVLTVEMTYIASKPMARGANLSLVMGTARATAKLTVIAAEVERGTGAVLAEHPAETAKGRTFLVKLTLPAPIAAEEFARFPRHGRCIVMGTNNGAVVGSGKVRAVE